MSTFYEHAATTFREFAVGASALAAAYAAIRGLNAWKQQKLWEQDLELAERLLNLSGELLEKFGLIKHPIVFNQSFPKSNSDAQQSLSYWELVNEADEILGRTYRALMRARLIWPSASYQSTTALYDFYRRELSFAEQLNISARRALEKPELDGELEKLKDEVLLSIEELDLRGGDIFQLHKKVESELRKIVGRRP